MAEPVPWQLAAHKAPTYQKALKVVYDSYNFSHVSVSNGTNPAVMIPFTGPGSAGAVPPSSAPQLIETIVAVNGTNQPVYGSNFAIPKP